MKIKDIIRRWTHTSLIWRIVVGLAVGAVLGLVAPQWSAIGLLGTLFVGALKAVAPVLVALRYKTYEFQFVTPYQDVQENKTYIGLSKGGLPFDGAAIKRKYIADGVFLIYND